MKVRFAGASLCGPKRLELNVIGVRLQLVMEQVIQTGDWRKCDGWEREQEGERRRATARQRGRGETGFCWPQRPTQRRDSRASADEIPQQGLLHSGFLTLIFFWSSPFSPCLFSSSSNTEI